MAPGPNDPQSDPSDAALDAVREALPEPGDEDLVEHRPEDEPPQDLRPLHTRCGAATTRRRSHATRRHATD